MALLSAIYIPLLSLIMSIAIGKCEGKDGLQCINGSICVRSSLPSLKFMILGDFGGIPFGPYVTYAQYKVAAAMSKVGDSENTEFQLALGNNFYYVGIADEDDPRFQTTFENVYQGAALEKPWYLIGGNLDHYGNISAQIAYTRKSKRWNFPSYYYKISYKFGSKKTLVEILMIDTVLLCGNTRNIEYAGHLRMLLSYSTRNPNKPKNQEAARRQWLWIEQQLQKSKFQFLLL